jgi:hypothetical protein
MMGKGIIRAAALVTATLALAGCGSLIPGGSTGTAPGTASQTASAPARPATRIGSAPQSYAPRPEEVSCLSDLGASGARFDPLPDTYAAPGCNKLGTVQLMALAVWLEVPGAVPLLPPGISDPQPASVSVAVTSAAARVIPLPIMARGYRAELVNTVETDADSRCLPGA